MPALAVAAFGVVWLISAAVYGGLWRIIAGSIGGLCVLLGLVVAALAAAGRGGALDLNRAGLLVRTPLGRSRFLPWDSVEEFVVFDDQVGQRVGLRLTDGGSVSRRATKAAARVSAVSPYRVFRQRPTAIDELLPSTYGRSAAELVELLEAWRAADGAPSR